jgi:hypothetical protein
MRSVFADIDPFILNINVEIAKSEIFECHPACITAFPLKFIETHNSMYSCIDRTGPVLIVLSALDNDSLIRGEEIPLIGNK